MLAGGTAPALAQPVALIMQMPAWGRIEDGVPVGGMVDLMREANRRSDLDIGVLLRPYARIPVALSRTPDAFTLMFRHAAIEEVATDVAELLEMPIVVFGRWGEPLTDVRQLAGRTVAVVRGTPFDGGLAAYGVRSIAVADNAQQVRLFAALRADAMIGAQPVLEFAMHRFAVGGGVVETGAPLHYGTRVQRLWFPKDRADTPMARRIAQVFEAMRDDGTIRRIMLGEKARPPKG